MGVHGLWELLAPVGHRVSNETVRNKVLAVDVSIWLTQFVKAMRDAEGAQVRNGHLLGVFRRCIKLLYLSVKPVFVFDGATPPLKRRTLSSRRAQREKHAAKVRRLAEKMLLNRIKQNSVTLAIAKKRKGKPREASTTLRDNSPSSPRNTEHQERKTENPCHHHVIFPDAVIPSPPRSKKNPNEARDHSSRGLVDPRFSDDSLEATGIYEMEISLPQNVADLDDEALIELPSKLQSEVFKQAKLNQRARHRENMLQEQQRPAEFSKMQIEGFLQHTALNRKISRVRDVLNTKSGASHRIASDSRRGFVLTEDSVIETHADAEGRHSEDEWEKTESPEAKSGYRFQRDLLADIRSRKEALDCSTPSFTRKTSSLDMHARLDSGNEWASKVLQGNGSLLISSNIPDVASLEYDGQPGFNAKDNFLKSGEEQHHPGIDSLNEKTNGTPSQKGNVTDEEHSDDDEWEDGNQPSSFGISEEFERNRIEMNVESERLCAHTVSDRYQVPAGSDRTFSHRHSNHNGSCDLTKKLVAASKAEELTTIRRDSVPTTSHHGVTQATCESIILPHSSITKEINDDHHADYGEGCAPLTRNPNLQNQRKPVQDLVKVTRINASDGGHSLCRSSDKMGTENQRKPLINEAAGFQGPNSSRALEEPIESRGLDKAGGVGSNSKTDNPSPKLGDLDSFISDTWHPKLREQNPLREQPILSESKERNHLQTEAEPCKDTLQSKELNQEPEVRDTESKTSRESFEEKAGSSAEDKQFIEAFHTAGKGGAASRDESSKTAASSCPPPAAKRTLDNATQRRICDLSDEPEREEQSFAQLETMQKELNAEALEINRQRSTYRGGADTVADEMYSETRDLIKLLGIPYLEAPTEAEAQCAFLNREKIVHGVLTEDSDAFLFGAVTVYRHLFAEGRFAEAYEANDIQRCLGLDQEKLIRLAYLLGSDYTSGVRGVGIVNSMEILEAFPGPTGLTEFRNWMKSVTLLDEEPGKEILNSQNTDAVRRRFCWKHRNMKRNWEVREGFPNSAVFEAYKEPIVDKCKDKFSWGSVDFEGLAKFCWDKFGWDDVKFEGAVGPLRQKLQEKSGLSQQRRIDEFFRPHRFAKIRSERLQRAVHGIAGDLSAELMTAETRTRRKEKRVNLKTEGINSRGYISDERGCDGAR